MNTKTFNMHTTRLSELGKRIWIKRIKGSKCRAEIKKCKYCKKDFVPEHWNQKYCDDKCVKKNNYIKACLKENENELNKRS